MDLLELNDDELKVFLNDGIPFDFLRSLYAKNNKLAQKLKGFRPNKAPKQVIVNTSYSLIHIQKDRTFIGLLTKFYDDYNNDIIANKNKMIENGCSDSIAYAIAINEGINEKFMPIYFKLEHITESEQIEIKNNIGIIKMIEICSPNVTKGFIKEIKESADTELNMLKHENEKNINELKRNINNLQEQIESKENEIINLKTKLDNFEKRNTNENIIDDKINKMAQDIIKDIDVRISTFDKNDVIKAMQSEIDILNKKLNNKQDSNLNKGFTISKVENDDFEVFDDYLEDCIGDIIENITDGNKFDALKEYLIEVIFSNKPIIVSENNTQLLASILSSILTGGNYYNINLNDKYDEISLFEELEKCEFVNENKVFIIRNKINISDHRSILNFIKNKPYNEKYIFEISYDKEVQFMPPETLEEFNLFIGKFNNRTIDYKYIYSFENENRKAVVDDEFEKIISALDINLNNKKIINSKFYGLLSYSHIPFKSIHDDIDIEELLNKIMKQSIRSKCEDVLND